MKLQEIADYEEPEGAFTCDMVNSIIKQGGTVLYHSETLGHNLEWYIKGMENSYQDGVGYHTMVVLEPYRRAGKPQGWSFDEVDYPKLDLKKIKAGLWRLTDE